jgi:hypothetical protein
LDIPSTVVLIRARYFPRVYWRKARRAVWYPITLHPPTMSVPAIKARERFTTHTIKSLFLNLWCHLHRRCRGLPTDVIIHGSFSCYRQTEGVPPGLDWSPWLPSLNRDSRGLGGAGGIDPMAGHVGSTYTTPSHTSYGRAAAAHNRYPATISQNQI